MSNTYIHEHLGPSVKVEVGFDQISGEWRLKVRRDDPDGAVYLFSFDSLDELDQFARRVDLAVRAEVEIENEWRPAG